MSFDINQLQSMLGDAKKRFEEARAKIARITVEANAGGGMVTVKMNGEKQLLEITLDPEVVKNDPDMLPDLIRAAVNEAVRRADAAIQAELGQSMGPLMGGLPLPF